MLRTLPPPPEPALLGRSAGARGYRSWHWHRAGWSCHRRPARPAGPSPPGTVWPGRLQGKGQGRDAGFAEMRQGHTRLCSPEVGELLPSLSWIHTSNTLGCAPGRETLTHPCALPRQAVADRDPDWAQALPLPGRGSRAGWIYSPHGAELQGVPGAISNTPFSPKFLSFPKGCATLTTWF